MSQRENFWEPNLWINSIFNKMELLRQKEENRQLSIFNEDNEKDEQIEELVKLRQKLKDTCELIDVIIEGLKQ